MESYLTNSEKNQLRNLISLIFVLIKQYIYLSWYMLYFSRWYIIVQCTIFYNVKFYHAYNLQVDDSDFYKEMVLRGYGYKDEFKMVTKYSKIDNTEMCFINWEHGNKVSDVSIFLLSLLILDSWWYTHIIIKFGR